MNIVIKSQIKNQTALNFLAGTAYKVVELLDIVINSLTEIHSMNKSNHSDSSNSAIETSTK